jgi:hypothetical protein
VDIGEGVEEDAGEDAEDYAEEDTKGTFADQCVVRGENTVMVRRWQCAGVVVVEGEAFAALLESSGWEGSNDVAADLVEAQVGRKDEPDAQNEEHS